MTLKQRRKPLGIYRFAISRAPKKIFLADSDYNYYLKLLSQLSTKIQIHHYCFVPSHVYFVLHAANSKIIRHFIRRLQMKYRLYYYKKYVDKKWLFKRHLSIPIEDESCLLECGRYIERNPIRAKLVTNLKHYPYSSYCFYAYGKARRFLTPSPAYLNMAHHPTGRQKRYRKYLRFGRPYEELIDKALLA